MATVAVAMSGGVDSSVAAYLLQKAGYKVIGITMQLWEEANQKLLKNEGKIINKNIKDAQQVAKDLNFPHYIFNCQELFKKMVINNFIDEYLQGRTPNPCVQCNHQLKFGVLLKKALNLGADFLATGHYVRKEEGKDGYRLLRGIDLRKDQSYFLYNLTQKELKYLMFPLGEYQKEDIRSLAIKLGLEISDKPESQEICFIENDYRQFISQQRSSEIKPGPILDIKGNRLGEHKGLPYYTIGQRKGLGLALGRPVYVVRLDPDNNAVIVGGIEELYSKRFWAIKNNFISGIKPKTPINVMAKVRYAAQPADAVIYSNSDDRVLVEFNVPQRAVTPGQAVVYYQGDEVVGGGTIDYIDS